MTFSRRPFHDMSILDLMNVLRCKELTYTSREFLMYNTYYYTYGYDDDSTLIEFMNREYEVIARLKTDPHSLGIHWTNNIIDYFNRKKARCNSNWEIVSYINKVDSDRINEVNQYIKYIDYLGLKDKYVNKIKQDIYYIRKPKFHQYRPTNSFLKRVKPIDGVLVEIYSNNLAELGYLFFSSKEIEEGPFYSSIGKTFISGKLTKPLSPNELVDISKKPSNTSYDDDFKYYQLAFWYDYEEELSKAMLL